MDPWIDCKGYPYFVGEQEQVYDTFKRNISNFGLTDKVTEVRGFSHEKIPELQDDFFDLIYIDGNHEPECALEDAVLAFRKLKVGGVPYFRRLRVRRTRGHEQRHRWVFERLPQEGPVDSQQTRRVHGPVASFCSQTQLKILFFFAPDFFFVFVLIFD